MWCVRFKLVARVFRLSVLDITLVCANESKLCCITLFFSTLLTRRYGKFFFNTMNHHNKLDSVKDASQGCFLFENKY